jgi:nucleotide-binding universal stress UspA family protein
MFVAGVADSAHRTLPLPVLSAKPEHRDGRREHVLIASDGLSDSAMPLAVGARLAAERSSRVTLLHAVGRHHRAEEPLLAQIRQLRELGVAEPDLVIRHGRAHEVIVDVAERMGASLVVVGSRRRSGPRALGSVSRHVIHEAGCSVLTVPPEAPLAEVAR